MPYRPKRNSLYACIMIKKIEVYNHSPWLRAHDQKPDRSTMIDVTMLKTAFYMLNGCK